MTESSVDNFKTSHKGKIDSGMKLEFEYGFIFVPKNGTQIDKDHCLKIASELKEQCHASLKKIKDIHLNTVSKLYEARHKLHEIVSSRPAENIVDVYFAGLNILSFKQPFRLTRNDMVNFMYTRDANRGSWDSYLLFGTLANNFKLMINRLYTQTSDQNFLPILNQTQELLDQIWLLLSTSDKSFETSVSIGADFEKIETLVLKLLALLEKDKIKKQFSIVDKLMQTMYAYRQGILNFYNMDLIKSEISEDVSLNIAAK